MMVLAPIIGMVAGFLLLFGGIFFMGAWQMSVQPWLDSSQYSKFTGSASGRIVESWIALEFDPTELRKSAVYWEPTAKIAAFVAEYADNFEWAIANADGLSNRV